MAQFITILLMFHTWRPPQLLNLAITMLYFTIILHIIWVARFKRALDQQNGFKKYRRKKKGSNDMPLGPFSVNIRDAVIGKDKMVFSAITLPLQHCPPKIQLLHKQFRTTNRCKLTRGRRRKWWLYAACLLGLTTHNATNVYAISGSNHVMIRGKTSGDSVRQQKYVDTIVTNASMTNPLNIPETLNEDVPRDIKRHPCCFVADTDSVRYILDTGANRIIVNNARLMYGYKPATAQIKGINGDPTISTGTGFINLPLKSDDGRTLTITKIPVMHVPSCPYNLMPPQILIKQMKVRNIYIKHFKHDDLEYILE